MIFQDKPDQQLCDDDKLIAVLNDGDQTADHTEVIDHIEQCPRCQQRFDELAAGAQDWTKARQALLNDDPCSENRVGSAKWDYSLRNEVPIAWTESMACQLLSPASHPELLGRLGRYDVERLIGSGGMGVVFKAHDSELNRPVAIKILAPYLSSSGPARKRFAREARAAAAVVHEHVVPIYNVETEREIPFLVMHYVAGESLQERVDREGALELCEILRIGMQVASGLSAAHQQGLVHRDIKPSNILMEQGVERALITDFGLARAADDASLTRTGFHPGTPQYMSPEQAAGEQVDARSDLFSLGSVLYTMCTGRPPFRAETSLGVLRRITDVEPRPIREINPNIPEWLCRLVARLMSKSPEDRFANALEVADLLGQCLAHVQQPAGMPLPVAVATTAPIRDRRPPIGKFIAAAAFVMALVFAGVFIVLESNKGTLTIQTEADDIRVRITQGDEVIDELKVTKSGQSVRVAAGQYKVEILGKTDELTVDNELVTLHRSGNEVVRIIRKAANYPTGNQTTSKNLSADEWQDKLQGNWNVVHQYVDDGVPKRHSSSATVLRNRMEVIPTDGQDSMMFDLVFGEEGPPQQIDLKPVLSDVERQELLQGWSSDNDEPLPEDLVNPIFHGIIELDSHAFRICSHLAPCSPRPIQFTDSSERVIWSFSKSELDESVDVRGTVGSEQPTTLLDANTTEDEKEKDEAAIAWLRRPVVGSTHDGKSFQLAGHDALMHCVMTNNSEALNRLLTMDKYDLDFCPLHSQWTLLQTALQHRCLETTSLLLRHGAKPTFASKGTPLPLELAKRSGREELVALVERYLESNAPQTNMDVRPIFARIDGEVTKILVGHNSVVMKGQILLGMRNAELQGELTKTSDQMNEVNSELARIVEKLQGNKDLPIEEVEKAERDRGELQKHVAALSVQLKKLKDRCELLYVKATVDGKVVTKNVEQLLKNRPVVAGQVLLEIEIDPSRNITEKTANESGYNTTEVAAELEKTLGSKESHNNEVSKGQSGTDVAKPLYADLQGDWIIDSFYFDEDANSRELQKQGSTALILRTIRVEANELYVRNPPVAGMTRTSGAISLKPVEGNDPRLFSVVDSQETFRFGMYKVDRDNLTILLTQEAPPKLLAPTEGEFYIECHRAVSEDDKELLNVINKNPDQINVIDLILKDFQKSAPAQVDTTTTGNVSGTEKPSPTQAPDTSNGESMDLFQEVAPPSTPDATSKLDFFTEGFHKLVITGNTSRSEYMHLKIGDEPEAQEWILGLGGRFIATFEYSDELSVKGGKKANGLRIGVKHGNGNVSRLQIEMTPVDSVSASSFRFREGALGKPLVDAAILYHEGRYRIGDVETIDGKKLPVFVQLKDITSAAGPNSSPSK